MDKYYFSSEISEILNPPPLSKFLERQREAIEEIYASRKKSPLGCSHAPNIPREKMAMIFGIPTCEGISAGDLMYPSGKRINQSVYSEIFKFKKLTDLTKSAGIKSDHCDNTGDQMKQLLYYDRNNYSSTIVPSSYANKVCAMKPFGENIAYDYREQNQEFNLDKDNKESSFEKSKRARKDKNYSEVLWNLLKIKNHVNFQDLASAFKSYQNGSGKITVSDLQQMFEKFGISAPVHAIEKLIEECDIIDKDGAINYEEFIHCLNWKDMLPENYNFKTSKYANDWREGINNPPEDTTDLYRTTSSFIGDHKYSVPLRNAGLPSHKDVDRAMLKGVSEFNECGDASVTIQPNSFFKYGVFEEDLKALYSKEQVKQILTSSGITFSNAVFEIVWHNVNCNGKASIGAVWSALKNECLSHCKHF